MKKAYEAPAVEVVNFCFEEQIVAASTCLQQYKQYGNPNDQRCTSGETDGYNHND